MPISKKIVVIVGPTASGKSDLAVYLARKFKGEVISADSAQVYRGMDIGTAKVTKKEMRGVPHYLLDAVSPKAKFTVSQYRKLALKTAEKIFKRGKIPILCGGTGFYIQAVIDGLIIPQAAPDWRLRKKLEKKSTRELFAILKKLDPERAKNIDAKNPRRLVRAIEIVKKTGRPVPALRFAPIPYPALMLGLKIDKAELKKRIAKRLEKMLKLGLEKEAKKFPLPIIGYREWKDYFDGEITKDEVKNLIQTHTLQYAKRQMTWFGRDSRIRWVRNRSEAEKLFKNFLN